MKPKIKKYHDNAYLFMCPICKTGFTLKEHSVTCHNLHSFDIASKGYINFLSKPRNLNGYEKESFEARQIIMDAGLYEHVLDAINKQVKKYSPKTVIDIGCGSGYFLKNVNMDVKAKLMGLDFSKDAIRMASAGINDLLLMVADIAKIPVADGAIDMILNIYTPSNYPEFNRILSSEGIILKAVPTEKHMNELRTLLGKDLKNRSYSNEGVKELFIKNTKGAESFITEKTFKINRETARRILEMTPMMFDRNKTEELTDKLERITVSAEILTGYKKDI